MAPKTAQIIKPGKVVILLNGRYAGAKVLCNSTNHCPQKACPTISFGSTPNPPSKSQRSLLRTERLIYKRAYFVADARLQAAVIKSFDEGTKPGRE